MGTGAAGTPDVGAAGASVGAPTSPLSNARKAPGTPSASADCGIGGVMAGDVAIRSMCRHPQPPCQPKRVLDRQDRADTRQVLPGNRQGTPPHSRSIVARGLRIPA